jgi:hypothetical protein
MMRLAQTQKKEVEAFRRLSHPAFTVFDYRHVDWQISWVRLGLL